MSSNQKRNDDLEFQDITLIEESISEHLCHSSMFLNDQYDVRQSTNANNEIGQKYPMSRNQHQEDIQLSCSSTFFSDCNKATEETEFYFNESYTYLNSEHDEEIKESITTNKNEVLETTANNREFSSTHSTKYEIDTLADISHWRRFINSLLSTKHAYAVNDNKTERSEPLSWKKKIVFGSCFAGVAILLIVVLVIAISTKPNGEDNSASKISTTAYIQALMELTVNSSYTAELQNVDSSSYRLFVADFCLQIDDIYTNGTYGLGETYFGCNILSLSEGSIVVSLAIYAVNVNEETIRSQAIDIMYNHFNKSGQYLLGKFHILRQTMKLIEVTTLHLYNPPNVQRTITTKYQQTDSIPSISSTRIQTTLTGTQQITASQTSFTTMSQNFAIISMIQSSKMSTPQPCQESHLVLKVSTSIGSTFLDSTFPGQSIISMYSATEVSHMKTPTQTFSEHLSTTSRKSAYSTLLWTSVPTIAKGQLNTISSAFAEASSTTTNTFTNRTSILTTTSITEDASTDPFAVHGSWLEWGQWSQCDVTCGNGSIFRTRLCSNQLSGGDDCRGNTTSIGICVKQNCPVDGKWSIWSTWEKCSVTCGDGGSRNRTRSCSEAVPQFGGINCSGNNSDIGPCELKPCPIDGKWSIWSTWEKCSVTCGDGGSRNRTRSCSEPIPQFGGKNCLGNNLVTGPCELKPCPIDGDWSVWTEWSACNATCANGFQFRQRRCTNPEPQFGGHLCLGNSTETNTCNDHNCPVHGSWLDWGQWSKCDVTCGNGSIFRTRVCSSPMYGGDDCFGDNTDSLICIKQHCPVDGEWSSWSTWEKCSVTCGENGSRNRTRSCTNPFPQFGGINCAGNSIDTGPCEDEPCPINGEWTEWGPWSRCSITCGSGYKSRTRNCTDPPPQYGGYFCVGFPKSFTDCNENQCTVQGYWTTWSTWEECSVTCGGGTRIKSRSCVNQEVLDDVLLICLGDKIEQDICNDNFCPVDGQWSEWSEWSQCSVTCGGGTKTKHRECENPKPQYGGVQCMGNSTESIACNIYNCPGGSCTNIITYVFNGPIRFVCTISGMLLVDLITIKQNNHTIAIINDSGEVKYFNTDDRTISVIYNEIVTVSIMFQNITCTDEGSYVLHLQDKKLNCVEIKGVIIVQVRPTNPVFYVNPGQLKRLPYKLEDNKHWCFADVGKPYGQLVLEMQPFNFTEFVEIPSLDRLIVTNSSYQVGCSKFQNITFVLNFTFAIEHGKLRCRVKSDETVQEKNIVATEVDLSSWERNTCTDVFKSIYDGTATITCTLNRTNDYDEIDIFKIYHGEIQNISKINRSGNITNVSSLQIRTTLDLKSVVSIVFLNVSCEDEGYYRLIIIKASTVVATVTGSLMPLRRPMKPTLLINPNVVMGMPFPDQGHVCFGNVGYPPGEFALDLLILFEGKYNYFEITNDLIIKQNDIRFNQNCEVYQNLTFELNTQNDQLNNRTLRCRVKHSWYQETIATEDLLTFIPKDICKCNTKMSGIRRGHPGRCDHYVECVNMTIPIGRACPIGQCRNSQSGVCFNDCSAYTCQMPVPIDFCDSITALQTLSTTPSTTEQSIYKYIQCTDSIATFNNNTAVIKCALTNTTFRFINITKTYALEHQWIGTINYDKVAVLSNMSIDLNITVVVRLNELTIKFGSVQCDLYGIYTITISDEYGIDTVNTSLKILRKPKQPKLQMNPDMVINLGFYRQGNEHICIGDVGEPPGQLVVEIQNNNSSGFVPVDNKYLEIQSKQFKSQTCRNNTMIIVFGMLFTPEMDGGRIRCRVSEAEYWGEKEVVADTRDLLLIPDNICQCNKYIRATRGHPKVCDVFVQCSNYTIPEGIQCPPESCRNSITGTCGKNCSSEVCQTPVPKDFCS